MLYPGLEDIGGTAERGFTLPSRVFFRPSLPLDQILSVTAVLSLLQDGLDLILLLLHRTKLAGTSVAHSQYASKLPRAHALPRALACAGLAQLL